MSLEAASFGECALDGQPSVRNTTREVADRVEIILWLTFYEMMLTRDSLLSGPSGRFAVEQPSAW
jgi:hypothetical protein